MIRLLFILAGHLLIAVAASVSNAQEAVLEIAVEAVEVEEVLEAEREVVEADLIVDADVVEVDVVEAAGGVVGGFFQMIAGGFGAGGKPRTVSRAALSKNVDEIKSDAELRKLERELGQHPNMQGMMPQLKTQLNVAQDIELRLLHLACNLKRSEFKAIQKEGKTATLRAQLKVCQEQIRAMQGGGRRGRQVSSDVTTLIEQSMLAIARLKLGQARSAAYQSEIEARKEFRREALIHSMASSLDSHLMFSAQQREEIMQAFRTGWSENWLRCVQYLANNGLQYFPNIPKKAIRGLLSEGQQKIFQSMPWQPQNVRMNLFNGNAFGFGQNGVQIVENELEFAPEDEEVIE